MDYSDMEDRNQRVEAWSVYEFKLYKHLRRKRLLVIQNIDTELTPEIAKIIKKFEDKNKPNK